MEREKERHKAVDKTWGRIELKLVVLILTRDGFEPMSKSVSLLEIILSIEIVSLYELKNHMK